MLTQAGGPAARRKRCAHSQLAEMAGQWRRRFWAGAGNSAFRGRLIGTPEGGESARRAGVGVAASMLVLPFARCARKCGPGRYAPPASACLPVSELGLNPNAPL